MKEKNKTELIKITVPAQYSMLSLVIKVLDAIIYKFDYISSFENELVSSIVEAYNNCIEHGYSGEQQEKTIEIEFVVNYFKSLTITIVDYGKGFNLEEYEEYCPQKQSDIFRFRGRGIFLMKNFVDKFEIFPNEKQGTTVIMQKFFNIFNNDEISGEKS